MILSLTNGNCYQSEEYTAQDQNTSRNILDEDNCGEENTQEGDAHVSPGLNTNNLKI